MSEEGVRVFDFSWKFKDFEIRTVHSYGKNNLPYVELVKWQESPTGKRNCFTLAYWHRNKDGEYELHFVGKRPLEYIAEIDVSEIWKQLCLAQAMFEDAENRIDKEDW